MKIDKNLFDELYRKHYNNVVRYVSRRLGYQNYMAIEDIVQDTFYELWSSRDDLEEHTNLAAWLTETAKKKMYSRWRKASSSEIGIEDMGFEPGEPDSVIKNLENELFLRSLLEPDELELLKKFHMEGYSQKELAEQEGISEGAMKVKLHRIRKKAQEKAGK